MRRTFGGIDELDLRALIQETVKEELRVESIAPRMQQGFESIDEQIGAINEQRLMQKAEIVAVESQLSSLHLSMQRKLDGMERRHAILEERIEKLEEAKSDPISLGNRIDDLAASVDAQVSTLRHAIATKAETTSFDRVITDFEGRLELKADLSEMASWWAAVDRCSQERLLQKPAAGNGDYVVTKAHAQNCAVEANINDSVHSALPFSMRAGRSAGVCQALRKSPSQYESEAQSPRRALNASPLSQREYSPRRSSMIEPAFVSQAVPRPSLYEPTSQSRPVQGVTTRQEIVRSQSAPAAKKLQASSPHTSLSYTSSTKTGTPSESVSRLLSSPSKSGTFRPSTTRVLESKPITSAKMSVSPSARTVPCVKDMANLASPMLTGSVPTSTQPYGSPQTWSYPTSTPRLTGVARSASVSRIGS